VPELQYTGAASITIAGILQVVGVFVFSLDQTGRILAYTGGRVFHFGEVLIILYLFVRLQNQEFLKRKCMSLAGIYICATLAGLSFIWILDSLWFCAVSHPMHFIVYGAYKKRPTAFWNAPY
jgi:hypothetical protein